MIRCNNCMRTFADDSELKLMPDDGDFMRACPECGTDEWLMDIDDEEQARLEGVARAYTMNKLTTMEMDAEAILVLLDEAGLGAERSMVLHVHEAVQNALAYLEDPEGYVAEEMGTDPGDDVEVEE